MRNPDPKPWRGLPISELTLVIALVMALLALLTLGGSRAIWAGAGALTLALLAGAELRSRTRKHDRQSPAEPGS